MRSTIYTFYSANVVRLAANVGLDPASCSYIDILEQIFIFLYIHLIGSDPSVPKKHRSSLVVSDNRLNY